MSTRLQIVIAEEELREIRAVARRHELTVSDWVRGVLREARGREPVRDRKDKLEAIRRAHDLAFPAADIDEMLADIDRGREKGDPHPR